LDHVYDYKYDVRSVNVTSYAGVHPFIVSCSYPALKQNGFLSDSFILNNSGNDENCSIVQAIIIICPLIIGLIFILSTLGLGDDHQVLKFGMLLFSLAMYFFSLASAIVIVGYYTSFTLLVNMLGLWIYVYGTMYFFVLIYFIIYLLWRIFNLIGQDKDSKLNY